MHAESLRLPQRIVLTGFMGSGKTTVGRLLSTRLGWDFVDLDEEITQRMKLSVPGIFAIHGEAAFRREEAAALADCLQQTGIVLALGGGAPEIDVNRALLQQSFDTAVVYLEGAFETLQARCDAQVHQTGFNLRPNFSDMEAARERFVRRTPLYVGISTLTLHTDQRTPDALAEELSLALGFRLQTP